MSAVLLPAMPQVKAWKRKVYLGMPMSWVLVGHHQPCHTCNNLTTEYLINGEQLLPLHYGCAS